MSRVWIMCELGPVASWQQWVNTGWYACFSVPLVFDRANYAVAHKWQHSHFVCMWYWFNIHNQYRFNSFRKQSWKGSINWICYLSGLFSYQVWMSMRFNHGGVGIIMGHFRNKIASVMLQYSTHLPLDKMAAMSQTIFSDVFSRMIFFFILVRISPKFVHKGPIDNIPHWCR